MPATISSSGTTAYVLFDPASQNPATVTPSGVIDVNSTSQGYSALLGNTGFAWTVTNLGTIESTGNAGFGVNLGSGGLLINGQSGSGAGYIYGTGSGVQINGTAGDTGTVVNYGQIKAFAPNGSALGVLGISFGQVPGTLINSGTITAATTAANSVNGVQLSAGGIAANSGLISSASGGNGFGVVAFAPATVVNSGTIAASAANGANGVQVNGGYVNNSGLISGNQTGVNLGDSGATLVNSGTVVGTGVGTPGTAFINGVNFNSGTVVNEASGLITARGDGIGAFGITAGSLAVVNSGVIQSTQTASAVGTGSVGFGIQTGNSITATVSNFGTISTAETDGGSAINFGFGGYLTNAATGLITAPLQAIGAFVSPGTTGSPVTVVNAGRILSTATNAIVANGITQFSVAVSLGVPAVIENSGTIADAGTSGGAAVNFGGGGQLTNTATGLITSPTQAFGAFTPFGGGPTPVTIVNAGWMEATGTGFGSAIGLNTGGIIANSGTISAAGTGANGIGFGLPGGDVVNGAPGTPGALVSAYHIGIGLFTANAVVTVANYGVIRSTQTGTIAGSGASGWGVQIGTSAAATITNFGTISAAETIGGGAVLLSNGGGLVVNGQSGASAATALISGYADGIAAFFPNTIGNPAPVTIANYGTVRANGEVFNVHGSIVSGNAIQLNGGGSILNGPGALITGYHGGILTSNTSTGVVTNFGTIASAQSVLNGYQGFGVLLPGGGTVVNYGLIQAAQGAGVSIGSTFGGAGTIVNFGTITETGTILVAGSIVGPGHPNPVVLSGGGLIVNGGPTLTSAFIGGYRRGIYAGGFNAVPIPGAVTTLVNYGTIAGAATSVYAAADVNFVAGGTVINHGLIFSPSKSALTIGTTSFASIGIVQNFGTIATASTTAGEAIYLASGGTVTNYALMTGVQNGMPVSGTTGGYPGVIEANNQRATVVNFGTVTVAGDNGNGVNLLQGGVVVNGSAGTPGATIYGMHGGIYMGGRHGVSYPGAVGTVVNYGTIENAGTAAQAVRLSAGGTVVNHALISSARTGISIANAAGTIDNSGTVVSLASTSLTLGVGMYLAAGGYLINRDAAAILAQNRAVALGGSVSDAATVVNSGMIVGATGIAISSTDTAANTIVNFGTVAGTSGVAIQLGSGNDRVVIESGSHLYGAIAGFHPGDSFDLPFLPFDPAGTVTLASNKLQVNESSGSFAIVLAAQNYSGDVFHLSADATGGTLITATFGQPPARDFDGNGTSDVLFHNTNGNLAIWLTSGGTVASSSIFAFVNPAVWTARGTGDFNGDGKSDILWQDTSGDVAVWTMNGFTVTSSNLVGFAGPSWHIRTTGDFNGDGSSDILFQNDNGNLAIWQMSGGTVASSSIFAFANPAVWSVRGAGDFNGDGTSDILWQDTSGDIAVWLMGHDTVTTSRLVGFADLSWHIRGTGDFNGDGTSDILFQNDNGNLAMWELSGGTVASSSIFGFANPAVWHIAGIGDYNGDGKADILWQDGPGDLALWEMNGTTIAATSLIGFANPSWQIVPPDSTGDTAAPAGAAAPPLLLSTTTAAAPGPTLPHPTLPG